MRNKNDKFKVMKKMTFITSIIFLTFTTTSMVYYDYYSLIENQSGHTGVDLAIMKIAYFVFAVTAFLVGLAIRSDKKSRRIFIIAGILGFIFIANIQIFEKAEIMLYYNDWLKCCM